MALSFEVFGPCVPQVGTGAANALEVLGEAADGGTITFSYLRNPIRSDAGGDAQVDVQGMGVEATIEFNLVNYDVDVLDKLLRRGEGAATLGQGGPIGQLLGGGGFLCPLYLPSSLSRPWYFGFTYLDDGGFSGKFGTRYEPKRVRMKAFRYVPPTVTTSATIALFTRAAP